jgi:hypothetical protein
MEKNKADIPLGLFYILLAFFPLAIAFKMANINFNEALMIFLAFWIYDRLMTHGLIKMLGIDLDD